MWISPSQSPSRCKTTNTRWDPKRIPVARQTSQVGFRSENHLRLWLENGQLSDLLSSTIDRKQHQLLATFSRGCDEGWSRRHCGSQRRRCQPLDFYPVDVSSRWTFLPTTILLSGPFCRSTGESGWDYAKKYEQSLWWQQPVQSAFLGRIIGKFYR